MLLTILVLNVPLDVRGQRPNERVKPGITFVEVPAKASGIGWVHSNAHTPERFLPETVGAGDAFLDYDNDGWKDLMVAQGHDLDTIERINPQFHYREPMLLARNTGQKFVDVSSISGDIFHEAWVGRGMAVGDIDNDGRIDAVVTTNGGPAHVLLNETEHSGHWITLQLIGHKSNRDGIGAVVMVKTALGKQWATVTTSSGYLSASDPRVHFGLGETVAPSCVEIRWPSGTVQTLTDIKPDRQVQVDEPVVGAATRAQQTVHGCD